MRCASRHLEISNSFYVCNLWEAHLPSVTTACRVNLLLRLRFRLSVAPGLQQPKSVQSRSTSWSSRRQQRCLILHLRAPLGASPHRSKHPGTPSMVRLGRRACTKKNKVEPISRNETDMLMVISIRPMPSVLILQFCKS